MYGSEFNLAKSRYCLWQTNFSMARIILASWYIHEKILIFVRMGSDLKLFFLVLLISFLTLLLYWMQLFQFRCKDGARVAIKHIARPKIKQWGQVKTISLLVLLTKCQGQLIEYANLFQSQVSYFLVETSTGTWLVALPLTNLFIVYDIVAS